MKRTSPLLAVASLLFIVLTTGAPMASGQAGLPVNGPNRRVVIPDAPGTVRNVETILKTNYRITLAGKKDGKTLGEISYLTCSPTTTVGGPISDAQPATTITSSGELTERDDGTLLWNYRLSFSMPVPSQTLTTQGKEPVNAAPVFTNIQYQQHNTQGSVILKPGKAYELLTVAGVTYSVTIAPESEPK